MHSQVYWIFFFFMLCGNFRLETSLIEEYFIQRKILIIFFLVFLALTSFRFYPMFSQKIGKIFALKLLNKFMVLHRQSRFGLYKERTWMKVFSFQERSLGRRFAYKSTRTKNPFKGTRKSELKSFSKVMNVFCRIYFCELQWFRRAPTHNLT